MLAVAERRWVLAVAGASLGVGSRKRGNGDKTSLQDCYGLGAASRRGVIGGGLGLVVAAAISSTAVGALEARGVRLGRQGGVTRLVVDLNHKVDFSVFLLPDPLRMVIDLPEILWHLPPHRALEHALVQDVRYGLFQPGNSRVVVDLRHPAKVRKAFVLKPGDGKSWRLVIDLASVGVDEFASLSGMRSRIGTFRPHSSAQPTVASAAPRSAKARKRKPLIILDPGHGGVDPGAIGASGTHEKMLALTAAREFRAVLEATGRYTVKLTRNRDIFLKLRNRSAIARRDGADLFMSVHADSIRTPSTRGLSVYTLSEKSSDAEASALADSQNKADIIAGVDLSAETDEVTNILIDLAQRETMNSSSQVADILVGELGREVKLLRRAHRYAGFAVLKAPDVPSVLMEMGYLSNRTEEKLLRTRAYRSKLAKALVRAMDTYFAKTAQV